MNVKKQVTQMPHSLEAEQALLGCLLIDTKIQVEISAFLKEDDFYAESHKYIFSAMDELIKANKAVDFVTLTDALDKNGTIEQAGGIEYITELTNVMPSAAGYNRYLEIVLRDSMLRRLIRGASEIIEESSSSTDEKNSLAVAEKKIFDISNSADTSEIVKISSVIPDVMTKIDEMSKDKSKFRGIKTQYRGIDALLNGVHESDLMILAARPAVGKTSFAMNIVGNIALQGYSCAVFSLEMSKEQLTQRMLCSVAGINMGHVVKGQLDKSEWLKMAKAKEQLSNARIFIDDSAMISPSEVMSICRRLKRKAGLDFVMIDYVQLMSPEKGRKNDNRQQEITEISRTLKILAKELNVPVLALSQLSRAVETENRRPQLSDLRESGAIEQDADIVMFIHRPDKNANAKDLESGKIKPNVAEIIVAKHRNGPTGVVKLFFKGECTKFLNINEDTDEPEDSEAPKRTAGIEGYEELPQNSARNDSPAADQNYRNGGTHGQTDGFDAPPPEEPTDYSDAPFDVDGGNNAYGNASEREKTVDDEIF